MEKVNSNNIHDYMDNINGGNPWNISAVTYTAVDVETQSKSSNTYIISDGKVIEQEESSSSYKTCKMPIFYYSKIKTLHSPRQGGGLSVIIVDDEMNVLKTGYAEASQSRVSFEFDVPVEAKWVLFNTSNTPQYTEISTFSSNPFYGKTVAFLGDSISTNGNDGEYRNAVEITIGTADVNVELSAYLTYYDVQAGLSLGNHTFTSDEIGTEVTFTPTSDDVGKVIGIPDTFYSTDAEIIYWEWIRDILGCKPIPVCWSGASISEHESDVDEYKASNMYHDAMVRKCGIRKPGTMNRVAPDYIVVQAGINDYGHGSAGHPTTDLTDLFDSNNFTVPTTDVIQENPIKYGFKEAYSILISKLRAVYPYAKIYLCTFLPNNSVGQTAFPNTNGKNTLPQYNNAVREIANYYGCGLIEFDKCGFTYENLSIYMRDGHVHPNTKGHALMAGQAIKDMLNN